MKTTFRLKLKSRDQMNFRSSINGYIIKKLSLLDNFQDGKQYSLDIPIILPDIEPYYLESAISAQLHIDSSKQDQVPFLYIQTMNKNNAIQLNIDSSFYQCK